MLPGPSASVAKAHRLDRNTTLSFQLNSGCPEISRSHSRAPGSDFYPIIIHSTDKGTHSLSQGHINRPRKVGTCPGLLQSLWGRVGGTLGRWPQERGGAPPALRLGPGPPPPHQPLCPWQLTLGNEAEGPST